MNLIERLRDPLNPWKDSTMSEAADEIVELRLAKYNRDTRIQELEAVIRSHGIPVKTATGGEAHYCIGDVERDAARYRWLRESWLDNESRQISSVQIRGTELAFDDLDAAIDAAMENKNG